MCDTVYQLVSDTSFRAKYVVDQARSLWNKKDKELSHDEQCRLIGNGYTGLSVPFLENNDFCYFPIKKVSGKYIILTPYFYNKKNKSVSYYDLDKEYDRQRPAKNGGYGIYPNPISIYNGYFVSTSQPIGVEDTKGLNNSYSEIIRKANNNSNPALVFYKFNTDF